MAQKKKANSLTKALLNILIVLCFGSAIFFAGRYFYDIWLQNRNAEQALVVANEVIDSGEDLRDADLNIGQVIGRMYIEGLIEPTPIIEGDDFYLSLNHGIGRVSQTRMPGSGFGIVALSAHRETFFRPLMNVKMGDIVTVEMSYGTFRYKIVDSMIVNPDEGERVYSEAGLEGERLALITCYPFNNFLPPNQRAIFFADRIDDNIPSQDA